MQAVQQLVAMVALIALLAVPGRCDSTLTMNFVASAKNSMKNCTVEVAQNPSVNTNITNGPLTVNFLLTRLTLAPCGVRTMHLHSGIDEMSYVLKGNLTFQHIWNNGTIVYDTVAVGQGFAQPLNSAHQVVNPSCTDTAVFLSFFTGADTKTTMIGEKAYEMPTSSLYSYMGDRNSAEAANTYFSYAPECLKRCGLGEVFGQKPGIARVISM